MIGDQTSILSNESSKNEMNSSNYSIPQMEEDVVTGSQFSNFILSSGGINAICGSADKFSARASQHDHLTASLSNNDKQGTLISNYISEEQRSDTYRISDDSIAQQQTPQEENTIDNNHQKNGSSSVSECSKIMLDKKSKSQVIKMQQ